MSFWGTILGMTGVTYLSRVIPMLALKDHTFSPVARAYLHRVPLAVLTALVVPGILVRDGALFASPANSELLAGVVCFFWAWRSKSMLQTILAGVATLLLLHFLAA